MELGSYKKFADVSTSTGICSPESFFMKQHQDLFSGANVTMQSNRNSVMTDDSGVFDDVISKSESFDSEFFEEQNKTLLSFPSPLAYNPPHPKANAYASNLQFNEHQPQAIAVSSRDGVSESELSKEPEQLEACMNPLFLFDSNSEESPENVSPEHSAINHLLTQPKTAAEIQDEFSKAYYQEQIAGNSDPTSFLGHSKAREEDLSGFERCCKNLSELELDSLAGSQPSSPNIERSVRGVNRNDNLKPPHQSSAMSWCCDTTPTLPKKMGQSESALSSPYQKVSSSKMRFSSSSDNYSIQQHHSRDNASTKSYPSKGATTHTQFGMNEGNSYLDFDCFTELDDCSSTLAYNEDGFYEDNPILLRTSGNEPRRHSSDWACASSGSSSSNNNNSKQTTSSGAAVRSKTSVNRRQSHYTSMNDKQSTLYQNPHLYPKKYEAENLPEHQIYVELHQLQEMLKELQMKGTRIEHVLHCIAKEKGAKCRAEESTLLAEWLELVRAKNRIVRRENQLMHMLSQKELEEIQEGITSKLRILMTKPAKSDVEASEEERLLSHLIQVVEKRNGIVQILEQERQNEEIEERQCDDLLSPEHLRDATTRQRTWRSTMSNFRNSKWSHRVKAYYGHNKL